MSYEEVMAGNTYHRFDSQFFKKEYLLRKQTLKPISEPLHLLMKEGTYGILPKSEDYVATGLPLIRGGDLRRPRLIMSDLVRVPESYFSKKYKVEKGDLLILVKGATIDSADGVLLIDEDFGDIIFNGSVFRIKLNGRLNPYFVMAFMRTSFFTFQKTLAVANNGIEYNSLDSIRNYLIPHFSPDFQTQIELLVRESFKQIEESQALYRQAEADLLQHLGLPTQPSRPVLHEVAYNVKMLDQSVVAARWDAEYYQPKYDDQEATIRAALPDVRLIATMERYNARGLQPEYVPNGKIHVVNSRHILETGLDYAGFEKTTEEFWDKQVKGHIKRNDILIYTTGANIGRTQVYLQEEKALANPSCVL